MRGKKNVMDISPIESKILFMTIGAIALFGFLGLILFLSLFVVGIYNRLVSFRNRFKNAFAQIDVQLKRRYDLIPNLVESAKGYMKFERETLEMVIKARNQAQSASKVAASDPADAGAIKNLAGAEGVLSGALGKLFALVENYPDLKANQNVLQVQEELTSTENKVSFARQAYNDAVMSYNTARETFPAVLLAAPLGFGPAQLFEVESAEEKKAPRVSFS